MYASKIYRQQNQVIHLAFARLGLPYGENKDGWISLFREIARRKVKGLSDLTLGERRQVIAHLVRQGGLKLFSPPVPPAVADWKQGDADKVVLSRSPKGYPGRPQIETAGAGKKRLLEKIEAYLSEAKRSWNYAHGISKHMFKVDRVQWCDADQLRRIVAALEYDARRHERFTG